MKQALVIGASGGIGGAVAAALESRGVAVTRLSRRADGLDVTDEASVAHHLGALEGPFDLVFIATGGLMIGADKPEKALSHITQGAMTRQFALNAIGPALILAHVPRLLARDGPAVVAALSARVGSIGDNRIGGWHGYRAAKAALNQIIRGAAIELSRTHRQAVCVALHPGTVATDMTRPFVRPGKATPPGEAARNLLSVIDGLTPDETGRFFDYAGKPIEW